MGEPILKLADVTTTCHYVLVDEDGEIAGEATANSRKIPAAEWRRHVDAKLPVATSIDEQGRIVDALTADDAAASIFAHLQTHGHTHPHEENGAEERTEPLELVELAPDGFPTSELAPRDD